MTHPRGVCAGGQAGIVELTMWAGGKKQQIFVPTAVFTIHYQHAGGDKNVGRNGLRFFFKGVVNSSKRLAQNVYCYWCTTQDHAVEVMDIRSHRRTTVGEGRKARAVYSLPILMRARYVLLYATIV